MARFSTVAIISAVFSLTSIQATLAGGLDGHWTGMLSGSKGSGQADIMISGKSVTYSYSGSQVPVAWVKESKSSVAFGSSNYKLTLKKDGSASFSSPQYGDASGTLSKQ